MEALVPMSGHESKLRAPSSVKLNEDVLGVIQDNLVELLANNCGDRSILSLRDGRTPQHGFELAIEELLQPVTHSLRCDVHALIQRICQMLPAQVLDNEGGPLDILEIQCLGMRDELDSIDPDEVDLGFVLLSYGPDRFDVYFFVGGRGIKEEIGKGFGAVDVYGVVFCAYFVDDGDGEARNPFLQFRV